MPDVIEKLVELQRKALEYLSDTCIGHDCEECPYNEYGRKCDFVVRAEYLIANGVTIQRWIPVTERLPKLIPSNAGKAYSEAVNVCTNGRKVMVAVWDGIDWLCDMDYWEAWGETITHWTPVLLPLPQPPLPEPPKGGMNMKNCGSCAYYDRTKMEHTDVCGGCVTAYVGDVRQEPSRWKPIPQTNADRIRAMTDEELARHLNKLTDSYPGVCRELPECHADLDEDRDIPLERCEGCWVAWLRQTAEEDRYG